MLNILVLSVLVLFWGDESKSINSMSQMLSIELNLNLEDYFNKILFFLALSPDLFLCIWMQFPQGFCVIFVIECGQVLRLCLFARVLSCVCVSVRSLTSDRLKSCSGPLR